MGKKINNLTSFQEYLLKQYGKSDNIDNSISLLIISDTHGTLNEETFFEYLKNKNYDACIMLGDHYNRYIEVIVRNIDKTKLFGIKGNHDYDYLSDYDIPNINGQIININGVKILGWKEVLNTNLLTFLPSLKKKVLLF